MHSFLPVKSPAIFFIRHHPSGSIISSPPSTFAKKKLLHPQRHILYQSNFYFCVDFSFGYGIDNFQKRVNNERLVWVFSLWKLEV